MKSWKLLLVCVVFMLLFTRCSPSNKDGEVVSESTGESTIETTRRKETETLIEETEPEILFRRFTKEFDGRFSEVFVLEIPANQNEYLLKPALSFNMVFGYQFLSEIVNAEEGVAGINGGFSYAYGRHGGVFIRDQWYYNWKTEQYPVLVYKDKEYFFMESAEFGGTVEIKGKSVKINGLNKPHEYMSNVIVYNPLYGKTTRFDEEHFSVTVQNDIIKKAGIVSGEEEIPSDGYVITVGKPFDVESLRSFYTLNGKVSLNFYPRMGQEDWAYECGDRLVRDGENVAPKTSGWVGTLEGYDPRTAVGVTKKGSVVLVVVDGRQPGYSYGVTAEELAYLLIELDVKDAALLDGGASTEMIFDGEVVNKPSYQGEERPMASAFVVIKRD